MEKQLTKYDRYRLKDVDAYRKRKREWARTPEQRAIRTEYMRLWRTKNRARHNELARQSHQRNKHKHVQKIRDKRLIKEYGINYDQKFEIVSRQNHTCKICSHPFKSERVTHVDHCHKTKKVRGILCSRCNGALGWFEKYRDEILNYL